MKLDAGNAGENCFGKAYGAMYENDTHANGSVDRMLLRSMIKLNEETVQYLYRDYTDTSVHYIKDARPYLEAIVEKFIMIEQGYVAEQIIDYCRKEIVEKCETQDADMVFGGTEEQIIKRTTYWCTDIARVCCILCQIAAIPARILITANTKFAYCGHSVVEAFYDGKWGVIDPTNGIIIKNLNGTPASAWEIQNDRSLVNRAFYEKYPNWQDFFPPGEQYKSVAIANYAVMDHEKYDYTTSRLNDYGAEILAQSGIKWADGLRWLHGEDDPKV